MKPIYLGPMYRHEERRCPKCGHLLDAATPVGHTDAPAPGDVTFCIECNAILIFAERMTMRSPTALELCAMQASPDWATLDRARAAMREINENAHKRINQKPDGCPRPR